MSGVWYEDQSIDLFAPSKAGCKTKLPNGNTVGQSINQGRAQLQAVIDAQNEVAAAGGNVNPFAVLSAFASFVNDYGPISSRAVQWGKAETGRYASSFLNAITGVGPKPAHRGIQRREGSKRLIQQISPRK